MDALAGEHIQLISLLGIGISAVVGAVVWFDNRIDKKLSVHAEAWSQRLDDHEKRELEQDELRHQTLLSEIQHVRDEIHWRRES